MSQSPLDTPGLWKFDPVEFLQLSAKVRWLAQQLAARRADFLRAACVGDKGPSAVGYATAQLLAGQLERVLAGIARDLVDGPDVAAAEPDREPKPRRRTRK